MTPTTPPTLADLASAAWQGQQHIRELAAAEQAQQKQAAHEQALRRIAQHASLYALDVLGDLARPLDWTAKTTLLAESTIDGYRLQVFASHNAHSGGPLNLSLWLTLPCPVGHPAQELVGFDEHAWRHRIDLPHIPADQKHKHRPRILAGIGELLDKQAAGTLPCPRCAADLLCTRCEERPAVEGVGGKCKPCRDWEVEEADRQARQAAASAPPAAPGITQLVEVLEVNVDDPAACALAATLWTAYAREHAPTEREDLVAAVAGLTFAVLALRQPRGGDG